MTHDPHTTDVNAHGGPRPEYRPPWLDRHPVAGDALGIMTSVVFLFILGVIIGVVATR